MLTHVLCVPKHHSATISVEAANPFAFWAQAAQLAWLPWLETLALARELTASLPRPSGDATSRSAQGPGSGVKLAALSFSFFNLTH
jgi:hypothetical protein